MAKNFKINDRVCIIATGEIGTVKGREMLPVEDSKRVNIEYVVKVGEGFNNWKSFNKKEIKSAPITTKEEPRVYTKVYDVVDGYKITLYAKVFNHHYWTIDGTRGYRELKIGYSIYCPLDTYDKNIGLKIARNRSRTSPFAQMKSDFNGEFNAETVYAIMDVKANYIKNNLNRFIKKKTN